MDKWNPQHGQRESFCQKYWENLFIVPNTQKNSFSTAIIIIIKRLELLNI